MSVASTLPDLNTGIEAARGACTVALLISDAAPGALARSCLS